MGAYAIRRNNDLPFVNGGISASMKSVQPQRVFLTKPYIVSACTIFIVYLGAYSKTCDKFPVVRIRTPIPKRFEIAPIGTLIFIYFMPNLDFSPCEDFAVF